MNQVPSPDGARVGAVVTYQGNHLRIPLIVIGVLVALTLISVTIVRLGDLSDTYITTAQAKQVRELFFVDRNDGSIAIVDARNGSVIDTVAPGTNGFLRGTLRGLARERRRLGVGAETPFILSARVDGRLTLDDPISKRQVDLKSFGATNAAVFEQFLTVRPATKRPEDKSSPPIAPLFIS